MEVSKSVKSSRCVERERLGERLLIAASAAVAERLRIPALCRNTGGMFLGCWRRLPNTAGVCDHKRESKDFLLTVMEITDLEEYRTLLYLADLIDDGSLSSCPGYSRST
ncbi:hypothetical protein ACLOJK_030922 [Asimina triloba]